MATVEQAERPDAAAEVIDGDTVQTGTPLSAEPVDKASEIETEQIVPPPAKLTPQDIFLRDTDGEYPMVRVGTGLKDLREALGQSLETVVETTRLRRDWLYAIETMNVKLVPAGALNNYLAAYAKHLDLDPKELRHRFELQCGAISEAEETKIDTTPRDSLPTQMKWASIAAGVMLVVGGMTIFGIRILNPDQNGAGAIVTAEAAIPAQPTFASRPIFDDAALAAIDAEAAPPLEIVALRRAWIEVRGADGTVFRERMMSAGETYRPRLGAGWTVNARDAGAFAWQIEGTQISTLGEDSAPIYSASVDAAAVDALAAIQPMTASVSEGSPSR